MFLEKLARLGMTATSNHRASRRFFSLACSAMLLGSMTLSSQALALSLPKGQKKGGLQLPLNSRLDDGLDSGVVPATTTTTSSTTTTTSTTDSASSEVAPAATAEATKNVDLRPFGLNDSDTSAKPAEETGDTPTFKIQASESNLLPNGTTANEGLPAKSMKAEKGFLGMGKPKKAKDLIKTPMDAAKATNSMPLALQNTEGETQLKAEFLETSEQKQIAALWDATLNRSPDIQFVVQKLVPTNDSGHAATVMTRMLGGVLAGSIGAVGILAPGNQAVYTGQNFAYQALNQLMGAADSKAKRKAQLGEAELISLYQMVRNTSDKLVDNYRQYKRNIVGLNRATTDFEDLNNMMQQARSGQDAAKQLDMEYTVRKAQRDVIALSDDIHRFRQGLVDMAGAEAVKKLEESVQEELQNLGESSPNAAIAGKEKSPEKAKDDKTL